MRLNCAESRPWSGANAWPSEGTGALPVELMATLNRLNSESLAALVRKGSNPMRLLLVEDDEIIGVGLRESLEREMIDTCWTKTCSGGERHLRSSSWDAVVLDLTLPDGEGLDLLTWMRRFGIRTPVLLLTARDSVEDRVRGLDLGGDDYLSKPFSVPELVSRLRALVRRSAGFAFELWEVGAVRLNTAARSAWVQDVRIELSPREFDTLQLLMQNAGSVVTRDDLWDALDLAAEQAGSSLLEVYVHHLRRKLGSEFIRTVRGVGYIVGG